MSKRFAAQVLDEDLRVNGRLVPPSPHWATLTARVVQFVPERANQLNEFMLMEASGMAHYGIALASVHEVCVTGLGLDRIAMQGIADYHDAATDAATAMIAAHRRFTSRYRGIIEAVDGGVRLPHDGRFFTGEVG